MTLQILAAPPASGKTTYCVQRVIEVRKNFPNAPIWVLVPDGFQANAFRLKLALSGGIIGVNVVTFNHFLREIIEMSGNSLPIAPDALIRAFIRKAINLADKNAEISYYSAIKEMPGFISVLEQRFAEFKRSMVYPHDFLEYAESQPEKIKEIAKIYAVYQNLLVTNNWGDAEGISWLAVEFLERNPSWVPNWPLLVIDGFDSFTKPQLQTLDLLSNRIEEILITLPGGPEMSRRVHQRFADTFEKLNQLNIERILTGDFPSRLQLTLMCLESTLGEVIVAQHESDDIIEMIELQSQLEEVREALRWMKARIMNDGMDIQECAMIIPDLTPYKSTIQAVADEFGLPVEFSVGKTLIETPVFSSLKSLLSICMQDFHRRLVLEAIRSPYINLGGFHLTSQDAENLDLLSKRRQVVSGKDVWLDSLTVLENSQGEMEFLEDDEFPAPQLPFGVKAFQLRQGLEAFFNWLDPLFETATMTEWISWLEDSLDSIDFWDNSGFQADEEARAALRQLMREQVLAERIVGNTELSYQAFLDSLIELAKKTEVISQVWPRPPAIKVLRTIEGRGLRHDAVALLGLSEGIFPRPQKADPFIDEDIRADLGLESAFDKFQLGIFYQSVTRANQRLLLTRPYLTINGEEWEPSPFWDEVSKIFQNAKIRIITNLDRNFSEAGSPTEVLTWATLRGKISPKIKEDLESYVEKVQVGREIIRNRLDHNSVNAFNGDLSDVLDLVTEKYGYGSTWSASRLENYSNCPHFYFVANMLKLEKSQEPELGMDIAQRGTILHLILERVYQEADDPTDLEKLLENMDRVANDVLDRAPSEYGFRTTLIWEQEQAEIKQKVKETIVALFDKSIGWKPIGYEAAFGMKDHPPLKVDLGSGNIFLRGLIDRIDQTSEGNLRIIDYKTGSSKLSVRDLNEGVRLQLPLYALAARDALGLGEPVDGFYWAIIQAKKSSLSLLDYGFENAVGKALEHTRNILEGVMDAKFKPSAPDDGCPNYCPAVNWCWSYKPKGSW